MYKSSDFILKLLTAFASALLITFVTGVTAALFVLARIAYASARVLPRTRSTTKRALRGVTPIFVAIALALSRKGSVISASFTF